jgi:FAD/FMN-containing dehydrogenase
VAALQQAQEAEDATLAFLRESGIAYEAGELLGYSTDGSFLTLGIPTMIVFPKDEPECVALVDHAVRHGIALVPRGTGSGTAGAAVAPPGSVLVDMERVGACDARGHRRGLFQPHVVDAEGRDADITRAGPDEELYVRAGAGRTSDETNRALARFRWTVAVVPSSGYSTFGGNFATNARGSGTPTFGAFGNSVRRVRIVASSGEGARVLEVTDPEEVGRLGGHHGLFGLVTELDVRITPIPQPEDMVCAILSIESQDVGKLGATIGSLMKSVAASCTYFAGEFLFVDEGIVRPDDPIRKDAVLGPYFTVPAGRRMILLYRGRRDGMEPLPRIAANFPDVVYREITFPQFRSLMAVRTAATGKALHRVNVPGCEDFIIYDPERFGDVLSRMFAAMEGASGRPVGHHYPDGIEVHYRPQAAVTKADIEAAWAMIQKLREAVLRPELTVEDRKEHGLGLALFRDGAEARHDELRRLKAAYDPANVFCPHLLLSSIEGRFVGSSFRV